MRNKITPLAPDECYVCVKVSNKVYTERFNNPKDLMSAWNEIRENSHGISEFVLGKGKVNMPIEFTKTHNNLLEIYKQRV